MGTCISWEIILRNEIILGRSTERLIHTLVDETKSVTIIDVIKFIFPILTGFYV